MCSLIMTPPLARPSGQRHGDADRIGAAIHRGVQRRHHIGNVQHREEIARLLGRNLDCRGIRQLLWRGCLASKDQARSGGLDLGQTLPGLGKGAADSAATASDEDDIVSEMGGSILLCDVLSESFAQPSTALFKTSSHHCRKLVGVVDCGVRGSALSRPSFLAIAISSMPCAIASDMPCFMRLAL